MQSPALISGDASPATHLTDTRESLNTALAGRYSLEQELGRGGMATVYLAHDLKHDRPVALKVLHAELTQWLGPERFLREISVAARLQHPHILPVHDSGSADGLFWYTMPYIRGESLRQRLTREPQLPLENATRIVSEVADALGHAHRHGIVHRDIKPENILLSGEHCVIADFGLARALDVAGGDKLTETGIALGTPAYMSPEQASSDVLLDGRSDLYSLGCVLYEMLAGEPPFTGRTAQVIIARRFSEPVPHLRTVRDVSESVERVVTKALARSPADRYPDAASFVAALKAALESPPQEVPSPATVPSREKWRRTRTLVLATAVAAAGLSAVVLVARRPATPEPAQSAEAPPTAPAAIRLAVLPFENLGDSANAYFADGVADAVRGKLVRLRGLEVIARASSVQYRQTTKPPQAVARDLGVRYLLTGTVRWAKAADGASRVQVSPELVEVKDATAPASRWQDTFEAPLSEVFQVQADIAAEVTRALGVILASGEREQLVGSPTRSLAAYDAYLKGEQVSSAMQVSDVPTLRRAVGYYKQAVALDSGFVEAWSQLSRSLSLLHGLGVPSLSAAAAARTAAERALSLAPARPEGHLALGDYLAYVEKDDARALKHYAEGYRLAPRSAILLTSMAYPEHGLGRWESALEHLRQAARLDPRSIRTLRDIVWNLLWLRRHDEAEVAYAGARAIAPADLGLLHSHLMVQLAQGDLAGARALLHPPPEGVDPAALVAHVANSLDLYWALNDAQQELLLRLTPSAYDENRAAWAIVMAQTCLLRGDQERGRAYADSAREAFEKQLEAAPKDAQANVFLGLALAYLGRKAEAIRAGERGLALMPLAKNSAQGAYHQHLMVRIHLLVGEPERALDLLEPLLEMPYYLTPAWLRIDPSFAPLKEHPRFEQLLERNSSALGLTEGNALGQGAGS